MAKSAQPDLFVVDGSNLATEGRSQPSLEQLNDAVLAFIEEFPDVAVTVVVDATFGHRIAKKEVKAFDEAVANNELVTPPAGAIGRGDAFVLSIANKAKAGVLSNDSFQEFHGEYDWLFDEGRLIGGKPVPHVGWVWVTRTPVRGPKSRQAVKDAKSDKTSPQRSDGDRTEAKQAANRRVRKKSTVRSEDDAAPVAAVEPVAKSAAGPASKDHVNDLMPFLEFVERHPVGTSCTAVVESYASHGAYARMDDVLIYVPLRMMDTPPPSSARKALTIGESVALVVVGFTPDRRSIDAALPHVASTYLPPDGSAASSVPDTTEAGEAGEPAVEAPGVGSTAPAPKKPARRRSAKKASAATSGSATSASATSATPPNQTAADTPSSKSSATRRAIAKKSSAKKVAAKKVAAKKVVAKKVPAKKTTGSKKSAAKTTTAGAAAAAKKSVAKTSAAKKPATATSTASKVPAKRAAKQRAAAKKSAATNTSTTKRAATKKAPAKRASTKRAATKQASS